MTARVFRETTLADVIAASGPLFEVPENHDRFVPFRVGSSHIRPEGVGDSKLSKRSAAWFVLDSWDCWHVAADLRRRGQSPAVAEVLAHRKAAELNLSPTSGDE